MVDGLSSSDADKNIVDLQDKALRLAETNDRDVIMDVPKTPPSVPPRPIDAEFDDLTSSEPSDGEIEADAEFSFYKKLSDRRNAVHIQHELLPTVTACPARHEIATMKAVSLLEEELLPIAVKTARQGSFCGACVLARPNRFPDDVLAAMAKKDKAPDKAAE